MNRGVVRIKESLNVVRESKNVREICIDHTAMTHDSDAMPRMPRDVSSQYNTLTKSWHEFAADFPDANDVYAHGGNAPYRVWRALKAGEPIPAGTPMEATWDGWHHPNDFRDMDYHTGSLTRPPTGTSGFDLHGNALREPRSQFDQIEGYERDWSSAQRAALDYERSEATGKNDPNADQEYRKNLYDLGLAGTGRNDQPPSVLKDTGEITGNVGLPGESSPDSQTAARIRKLLAAGGVTAAALGAGTAQAQDNVDTPEQEVDEIDATPDQPAPRPNFWEALQNGLTAGPEAWGQAGGGSQKMVSLKANPRNLWGDSDTGGSAWTGPVGVSPNKLNYTQQQAFNMVGRQMTRAGIADGGDASRSAITEALLAINPTPEQMQLADQFRKIVESSDQYKESNYPDSDNHPQHEASSMLFGRNPSQISQSQFSGVRGPGITQDDIDAQNGRKPEPFEHYSEGNKQAADNERDYEFSRALLGGKDPALHHGAAMQFDQSRGQTKGESGFLGAMQNPEYSVGKVLEDWFNPITNAVQMAANGPPEDQWINPTGIDEPGVFDDIIRGAVNTIGHLPKTFGAIRSSNIETNKVSPLLPNNPQTPIARIRGLDEVVKRKNSLFPTTVDAGERFYTGEYPSFLGSNVKNFAQNMVDPTLALTVPSFVRAGAAAAAKATTTGSRIAQQLWPLAREAGEEGAGYTGIVGALMSNARGVPPLSSWLTPGNKARTDLYVIGEDGTYRPQTDEEFSNSTKEDNRNRREAIRNTPAYLQGLPKSKSWPF